MAENIVLPSAILPMLAGITERSTFNLTEESVAIEVDQIDAMAARILQYTMEQFPTATVGQVIQAITNALFWRRLISSMTDAGSQPGGDA